MERREANRLRYRGGREGHYESYFLRANHRELGLGFWVRYTIFAPKGQPDQAEAELWAAVFDDRPGGTVAVYKAVPFGSASFAGAGDGLDIRIGDAALADDPATGRGSLAGAVSSGGHEIRWDLTYEGSDEPVLLLAERLYQGRFPKAKVLVPGPMAAFTGRLVVDGEPVEVAGWTGSQNHNWGSQHTDEYAWGQVAGFDNAPGSFLECSTARVRVAGLRSPWLSPLVLRHDGRQYALTGLAAARRAAGAYRASGPSYTWTLRSAGPAGQDGEVTISAEFSAPAESFVTFAYRNPPGRSKKCLNTKIAQATVSISEAGAEPVILRCANRAAFEILS
jgi:hypothetical protein